MTRNDIHSPSHINPVEYAFVGLTVRQWQYGYYPTAVLTEKDAVSAHMAKTGGQYSGHTHGGSCHVCGASATYLAVFHHEKTNVYIQTGMDCAETLGLHDAARFKAFKKIVKAAQDNRAGKKKAQGLLLAANLTPAWELYVKHVALPEEEYGFIASIKAAPADAFRRGIYADWLAETGREDMAEQVRAGFPVEHKGLPIPQGPAGDVVWQVKSVVKYGKLPDWVAAKIHKALMALNVPVPVAAPVAAPVAPVAAPVTVAKPTYEEYVNNVAPGAWAVYVANKGNANAPYAERTVADIVSKGGGYGSLTPNQINYVKKLVTDIANRPVPAPVAAPVKVANDLTAALNLFKKAAAHLKFPKVRLQLDDGSPVVLALAGPKSKYAGQIMITDGGPYGESKWYGVVNTTGAWKSGKENNPAVLELVKEFAADPVGVATAYGKLIGSCCFCGKKLTDERSTSVGYGGTCAAHWGMPWGEVTPIGELVGAV